jgi:hypothetical protein
MKTRLPHLLTISVGVFAVVVVGPCLALAQSDPARTRPTFTVDASKLLGPVRPVNGVNGGPRFRLGNSFDNSPHFRQFDPPLIRLHDVRYSDLQTVDVHCIFPDFSADPDDPASYRFEKTDKQIKSNMDLGCEILFRLGESIEWGPDKYYLHPPKDFEKWARVCCNIVRHYNMGWAEGRHWNIKRWEIWNEPNVRACWTGGIEQYCRLYAVTSKALKRLDPNLMVGGPALAGSLNSKPGRQILGYLRDHKLPVDFISWHGYVDHPRKHIRRINASIDLLKKYGFDDVETLYDEWNYRAPGRTPTESFSKVNGPEGCAFIVSTLSMMLDTELDYACYYSAFGGAFRYGLFNVYGDPYQTKFALIAFNQLRKCGSRLATSGADRKTARCVSAAIDEATGRTVVLLSNFDDPHSRYDLVLNHLPFTKPYYCTEYVIDKNRSLELDRRQTLAGSDCTLVVELPKSTVRLLILSAEATGKMP